MVFGPTPFETENKKKTQQFIEKLEVIFPENIEATEETKSLIKQLLEKDPEVRMSHFPNGLREHPWFLKDDDQFSVYSDFDLAMINDLSCFYMEHTNLGILILTKDPRIDTLMFKDN